jgi:Holliday junction resolvase-like predicted endonuclease
MTNKRFTSWHVGVAAEAIAAAQFARCGYDVSVQYGANQPGYDLIVGKGKRLLKVSVKGSQKKAWGLCQGYLNDKNQTYHAAINAWKKDHNEIGVVLCFVQFQGIEVNEMPRVYLATPDEVAKRLHETKKSGGDTVLHERKEWTKRASASGTIDAIPNSWRFSERRIEELFKTA